MPAEEIIVADSSPLIGLARIQKLDLLRALAKRIITPAGVWQEVLANRNAPGAALLETATWIEVTEIGTTDDPPLFSQLDRGEAEAILLAQKHLQSVLLIDDLRGRKIAARRGLRIIGTVGLLLRAKSHGFLPELKPALEALVQSGIYIHPQLIQAALIEAGEFFD